MPLPIQSAPARWVQRSVAVTAFALLCACGGDGATAPGAEKSNIVTITLVAGGPEPGAVDGTGSAARFNGADGIAVDSNGYLYVADANNTIRKISPSGEVSTLAGVAGQSDRVDGAGAAARFGLPAGLAIDDSGNLFVADATAVRKVSPSGLVTTVGTVPVDYNNDGRSMAVYLAFGIAVTPDGRVYVTNQIGTHRITASGTTTVEGVATVAGLTGTRLIRARGITSDAGGTVYLSDLQRTVSKITPDGKLVPVAGTPGAYGHADGTGTAASFNEVRSLAADAAGNIYAADAGNSITGDDGSSLIRKITPAGVVTTIAGTRADGTQAVPSNGSLSNHLGGIWGIAVDKRTNTIYATVGGTAVYKITPGS